VQNELIDKVFFEIIHPSDTKNVKDQLTYNSNNCKRKLHHLPITTDECVSSILLGAFSFSFEHELTEQLHAQQVQVVHDGRATFVCVPRAHTSQLRLSVNVVVVADDLVKSNHIKL
jgi:hypothetical protein